MPNPLSRRARAGATVLLLALAMVGSPAAQPADVAVTLTSGQTVTLKLQLQPDHVHHTDRLVDAAREALDQYSEWFAPYPHAQLAIVDVPWRSSAADRSEPGTITIQARWLQPERSLMLEAQVARGIARQWWGGLVTVEDRFLADGIAEYAQSRTLERIYDRRHQRVAYSTYETRLFGGFLPWAIRAIRLDRQTSGIGREAFRRNPVVDLHDMDEALRPAQAGKTAAVFVTLERYLGWPVLQRGLRGAVKQFAGHVMTTEGFAATLGGAADRDLSWFFDQAFDGRGTFDYAVDGLSSELETADGCGVSPCYRSTIALRRLGTATFSGTGLQPVGEFEAGRANEISVGFADGQHALDHWDGRAESKPLVYHGAAPVVSAQIDPRRVLVLDLNRVNNARRTATPATRATLPWSVRWTAWLQDLMLTHAFLF